MSMQRRIILACSIGALSGTGVNYLFPPLMLWLGVLIGMLIATIVFAWQDIAHTAGKAARNANNVVHLWPTLSQKRKWGCVFVAISSSHFLLLAIIGVFILPLLTKGKTDDEISMLLTIFFFMPVLFFVFNVFMSMSLYESKRFRESALAMIPFAFAIDITIVISILAFLAVKIAVFYRRSILVFLAKTPLFLYYFVKFLFWYIYNRELRLVLTTTAFSTLLSSIWFIYLWQWQLFPTLAGSAAVGALLGLANYELVSIRLLKIQHRTS